MKKRWKIVILNPIFHLKFIPLNLYRSKQFYLQLLETWNLITGDDVLVIEEIIHEG